MQHRQGERSRLAGAGLCPGQKVMPFKHGGDCLRLNGGRCLGVALFEHSLQDGGARFSSSNFMSLIAPVRGAGYRPVVATFAGGLPSQSQADEVQGGSPERDSIVPSKLLM